MDKSILLAFFYVLQNSGFHLTCDQAFFFWGGGGRGRRNSLDGQKGNKGRDIYFPFSPRLPRKKEEEMPDHGLVSIYMCFKFYLKFSVGSLRHLLESLNRSFFLRIRGAVYGLTH